jgi:hypothetical protein
MKRTIITLWLSLVFSLSALILPLTQDHFFSTSSEVAPITAAEMRPAMEATVQIFMFPIESYAVSGVDQKQESIKRSRGLGTLVNHKGEIILITHDHWSFLDTLEKVLFRNAAGDQLLVLDGETFKDLIRYRDGGTLILGKAPEGDQPDYLLALVWASRKKNVRRVIPAELGIGKRVGIGETLIIARQGRNGTTSVELIKASVEAIEERFGQPAYKLRSANGEYIIHGDSGGGLWLGEYFVGNMWKSGFDNWWNWGSLELEQKWTEISFGAQLPENIDGIIQNSVAPVKRGK